MISMRFCPRCGSKNINWILPQDWSKWECKDCGYIGAFIIEEGEINRSSDDTSDVSDV